jgi:hypothetical protein
MPTTYTSLLGLALPATGELSGTWGATVNDYITQYVDAAVAGAQTISGSQTAVTLSVTNGTSLSQAGSGSTGSSQYQIINCTGNPASALTVTVPSASKVYLVLNNTSTNQTVTVKGSATTGVTVAAARAALIAWNGTDYELVATDDASKMNGVLAAANGGTGQSSYAVGDTLYATGTTALSKLAIGASGRYLSSTGTAPQWSAPAALTKTDDTNVTLTLGGSPTTALLNAASITAGWTGQLSVSRGGTGASTLTGYVYGNGTGAFTASTTIPNSATTATSANTASAIVARDASGNFSAGTITATLSGSATQVSNSLTLATSGTGLSGSATFNGSSAQTFTVTSNATSANTVSTIVARDSSGNFSAGTITATLSGNATNVTGTVAVANGGTGSTSASGARTNLGATTVGANLFTLTNPSAVTFPRFNADNTVSALDAATFRSAIGAGTGGGSVTSVSGTGTVQGLTLTGTVTSSGSLTLGGSLSAVSLTTQVTGTLPIANGGTGSTSTTFVNLASNVTGTLPVANGGTGQTSLTANQALFGNGTSGVNASSLLQIVGSYIRPTAYADTVVAAGNTGTALTLTCTNGNVFTATLTGNATITLSSPVASGSSTSLTLILTNDGTAGRTVAWAGGSFVFPGGAASLSRTTTANATDVWVFFTTNGGTTWYGNIAMKDVKA